MDSATLSSLSTIKIVNTLLLPPLQKSATLSPPKPKQKPVILRTKSPFLTHCSAKPHTHKDNAKNGEDLSVELLSSRIEDEDEGEGEAKPIPNQAVSSSLISRGLVLDLGCGDSWDNVEIGSPVVKRYLGDEEERWLMWYHGRSGKNPESESIGLAVSSNGIHWERGIGGVESSGDVGMVMNPSQDWWGFDTLSVIPSEVSIMSSAKLRANSAAVYWLYYTGFSAEKLEFPENFPFQNPERACSNSSNSPNSCFKSLPGLAMSQDGRHWARIEGEHHSGALFDSGQEGEWDSLFVSSPNVLFHGNGDLRMYYHSFDIKSSCFAIGMARSRDGIKWVKLGKILGGGGEGAFDEMGVMNPNVVRNKRDGGYVMGYEGVGVDGKRSIGMAVSSDGLKGWRRVNDSKSVLKQCEEEDGWDSEGVGSPCLVEMDNGGEDCQWRLYYRGVGRGGRTGIGLALSDGADFQRFQRWTGFHI